MDSVGCIVAALPYIIGNVWDCAAVMGTCRRIRSFVLGLDSRAAVGVSMLPMFSLLRAPSDYDEFARILLESQKDILENQGQQLHYGLVADSGPLVDNGIAITRIDRHLIKSFRSMIPSHGAQIWMAMVCSKFPNVILHREVRFYCESLGKAFIEAIMANAPKMSMPYICRMLCTDPASLPDEITVRWMREFLEDFTYEGSEGCRESVVIPCELCTGLWGAPTFMSTVKSRGCLKSLAGNAYYGIEDDLAVAMLEAIEERHLEMRDAFELIKFWRMPNVHRALVRRMAGDAMIEYGRACKKL